jgi:hypothetical protein
MDWLTQAGPQATAVSPASNRLTHGTAYAQLCFALLYFTVDCIVNNQGALITSTSQLHKLYAGSCCLPRNNRSVRELNSIRAAI